MRDEIEGGWLADPPEPADALKDVETDDEIEEIVGIVRRTFGT